KDLADAAKKFVDMSDDLNEWRENAFFAIFDRLVQEALLRAEKSNDKSAARQFRESSMILEVTPPGAKRAIKKVLLSPR
ncbi:MAG: hypothetical protein JNK38_22065, partial [Acidobacteria bacterium]|nr:hypothetical protein [Acidobacteriota bacterium]